MPPTDDDAFAAIVAHHASLVETVTARAHALEREVTPATIALLASFLLSDVLPHAAAEEETFYRAAAHGGEAAIVATMTLEHRELASLVAQLTDSEDDEMRRAIARRFLDLFTHHVQVENDVILPTLRRRQPGQLTELLAQMHTLLDATPPSSTSEDRDPVSGLVALLVRAADALRLEGASDEAAQVLARAWTLLRSTQPALAAEVTTRLHRIARDVTPTSVTIGAPAVATDLDDESLDVRPLPPRSRHEAIFAAYAALAPGRSFELVNDHDPKPLRYQFDAEHAGEFSWDYLESGPRVWRVRIGRSPV